MTGKNRESLPLEALGWSWGAFFLPWVWGIFNRVWASLLTLGFLIGSCLCYLIVDNLDYDKIEIEGVPLGTIVILLFGLFMIMGSFVSWLILAIKGRQWAWKNGNWRDIEHFVRVQRLWAIWGLIIKGGFWAYLIYYSRWFWAYLAYSFVPAW